MSVFRKNKPLLAVMAGNHEGLAEALAKGIDPSMPGPSKMTALHIAALLCDDRAAQMLLAAGAQIEARDKNDLTPLGYAVLPVRETPLPQLKQALKSEEETAGLDQARSDVRKTLLAAGADWHAKSKKAPSPWERFEHYWPEQARASVPKVGPAKV